jgi:hypothetical protein
MFGFIHRLFIEHSDDKENPLVYLQLCMPYDQFHFQGKEVNGNGIL